MDTFRDGNIVKPYERLNQDQLAELHRASMAILKDPGIWCYNRRAAELFKANGAEVVLEESPSDTCWRVRIPEALIIKAIASAPSKIILGARAPPNRLDINAEIPRVYFGSGSERNIWLETALEEYVCATDNNRKRMLPRHT